MTRFCFAVTNDKGLTFHDFVTLDAAKSAKRDFEDDLWNEVTHIWVSNDDFSTPNQELAETMKSFG